MMKIILTTIALLASVTAASAQYGSSYGRSYQGLGTGSNPNSHYVRPHYQRDGDFVSGHRRTNPDSNPYNNYSTSPNYNPYSGLYGGRRNSGF
jgi:hypothetical protein